MLINYTAVQDRVNTGVAITPIEFTVFMQDSGYNPISIQAAQIASPKTVLSLYNTNINGRFSQSTMGSFCALAPSIFGAISNFFTTIRNFANKITDIINAIASFSFAALLEALKSKITNVIESAIAKVKKVIENFTLDGLVSQVNQYFHSKVVAKFNTIKNEAMKFFEEINIEEVPGTAEIRYWDANMGAGEVQRFYYFKAKIVSNKNYMADSDFKLFLDLKLYDIPNTVKGAVESVADLSPKFLTVHASGGSKMISAAAKALPKGSITAVTVLTSFSEEDFSLMGQKLNINETTKNWASNALSAGATSLVCSAFEVGQLRKLSNSALSLIHI